jgi:hypothetical protein
VTVRTHDLLAKTLGWEVENECEMQKVNEA